MFGIYGATERLAPEGSGFIHVGSLAVDEHSAKAGKVHIDTLGFVQSITLYTSLRPARSLPLNAFHLAALQLLPYGLY